MNKSTVLIVEDHQLLRIGLRVSLEKSEHCAVIGEAKDGESAIREAIRLKPEVILMDIGLPGMDGIEATWKIKNDCPRTRIIMFTSRTEPDSVSAAFGAGADGYCVKDAPAEQVISAIATVARNEIYLDPAIADVVVRSQKAEESPAVKLSEKEIEILALIRDEINNQEIAARLKMNSDSVARVIHNVVNKFVEKKASLETLEQKERGRLKSWLTAFTNNLDEETIFNEKYLIQSLLGAGGIGTVFRATHMYIDRTVAIKMLHSDLTEDKLLMRSFQREGTAVANLHHRNIVGVYDFGLSEDQVPYMVMEYIEGKNLSEIITEDNRLDTHRALRLFTQVCDGLSAAHAKDIIHCDLKPSNILVVEAEGEELVKLVDFGLVQMLPQNSSNQLQLTEKYIISGTPNYMSPEQCTGKVLDERSDIYSLGCVLFETLTGQPVFDATTALELFAMHLHSKPPTLRSVCPAGDFCDELEDLVARMLAKNPEDRPQDTNQVKMSLFHSAMAMQSKLPR